MNRKKKLLYNTTASLIHQIITLVCGIILPRYFIRNYSSDVNGLVSSITNFLSFISLAECGVGAVVQASLYKPLAMKDNEQLSKVIISSEKFFKKVAHILAVYVVGLIIFYPLMTIKTFGYFFTASLILILSIGSFVQYYYGMSAQLLLNADQLSFITIGLHAACLVLNTVISVALIHLGASVHVVKIISSLIFIMRPILICFIVKKKYKLNKNIVLVEEPIKQKWNGLAQHISHVILSNTDITVLTVFSTLKNVSVYSVYYMIVNGVKQIVMSLTNGMQSLLGSMYAKQETEKLKSTFEILEMAIHFFASVIFTITALLIVSFVRVYTKGVTDTNYIVPLFGTLITYAYAIYCIRLPYSIMVISAGHFKETQMSAIVEALLNIVVSIALVIRYGLIGVSIGTILAMLYRTCYFAWYLSKNILYNKLGIFIKHICVDILCVAAMHLSTHWINTSCSSYLEWIVLSVKISVICCIVSICVNYVFYRKIFIETFLFMRGKFIKKSKRF